MKALVNGISLTYDETGHGPAVLLLHSTQGSRRMWDSQIAPLAQAGFRIIAPDLRGFGQTPAKGEASPAVLADDMAALLQYLGIGRVVLIGQGLGGEVLLEMLRRHRRKVAGACYLGSESPLPDGSDPAGEIRNLDLPSLIFGGREGRGFSRNRHPSEDEIVPLQPAQSSDDSTELNEALLDFLAELKGDACCYREAHPA